MELVLFDLPATINAVPIEKLNLAQLLGDEPVPAPSPHLPAAFHPCTK